MQSMSVKTAQVVELAGQIKGGAGGIKSQLDQLESEVSKLRAGWSGESQQAYDIAQAKWNQSLTDLNQLLQLISQRTIEIAETYDKNDKITAGRFENGQSGAQLA
jgi:6 kDa early secretory antigenic target